MMIVKCVATKSTEKSWVIPIDPNKPLDENNYIVSNDNYTIDSRWSGYPIKMGNEYTVYGILIFKNQIRYLIFNNFDIPGFYPSCLFDVVENYLLYDWGINIFHVNTEKYILIISEDVVNCYEHFSALVDCQGDAIKRLLDYKNSLI